MNRATLEIECCCHCRIENVLDKLSGAIACGSELEVVERRVIVSTETSLDSLLEDIQKMAINVKVISFQENVNHDR